MPELPLLRVPHVKADARHLTPQPIHIDHILTRPTGRHLEELLPLRCLEQPPLALVQAVPSAAAADAMAGGLAAAQAFDVVTQCCAFCVGAGGGGLWGFVAGLVADFGAKQREVREVGAGGLIQRGCTVRRGAAERKRGAEHAWRASTRASDLI